MCNTSVVLSRQADDDRGRHRAALPDSRRVPPSAGWNPPRCRMTTTDLPASLISTLPGQYYTDPAIFALEQTRVFETMWFCAVRSADLPTPEIGRASCRERV